MGIGVKYSLWFFLSERVSAGVGIGRCLVSSRVEVG